MTPQEALQILDQAASQVQAVRAFHEQVVSAVKVLNEFVRAYQEVNEIPTETNTESEVPDESQTSVEGEIVEE